LRILLAQASRVVAALADRFGAMLEGTSLLPRDERARRLVAAVSGVEEGVWAR
jgi:hypothetical protein